MPAPLLETRWFRGRVSMEFLVPGGSSGVPTCKLCPPRRAEESNGRKSP